jgi:hypothetical protein
MLLYHRTSAAGADVILRSGFKDATGAYVMGREWSGVWVSDRPLDESEGARSRHLLVVRLNVTEAELADYEWVEEGKGCRESLVPAALLNAKGSVALDDGRAQ